MDSKLKKIKTCVIGNGAWGSSVADVLNLINRYDVVGVINSTTEENIKKTILENSELWYIAIPNINQFDYLKDGILNKKHIICESPLCKSIDERGQIYDLILNHPTNKVFYCNFPYFLDQDFTRLISGGLLKKAKFFSIKCYGPKFKNEPEKAKKFYINQAFNLIFNTAAFLEIKNFEKFIVKDNFSGELHVKDITYLFEWGYNEYPKLDLAVKGEDYSTSSELIYDRYDQIMPLLINLSDKILNIDDIFNQRSQQNEFASGENNLMQKLSISSYLIASSAEYFSDAFCKLNGQPFKTFDASKLFLNGGFDKNYSIIL